MAGDGRRRLNVDPLEPILRVHRRGDSASPIRTRTNPVNSSGCVRPREASNRGNPWKNEHILVFVPLPLSLFQMYVEPALVAAKYYCLL